jgi:hypothetical protein
MRIFFRYFSPKNKSVALLCMDFLAKNYRKNLASKITRLINTSYLSTSFCPKLTFKIKCVISSFP